MNRLTQWQKHMEKWNYKVYIFAKTKHQTKLKPKCYSRKWFWNENIWSIYYSRKNFCFDWVLIQSFGHPFSLKTFSCVLFKILFLLFIQFFIGEISFAFTQHCIGSFMENRINDNVILTIIKCIHWEKITFFFSKSNQKNISIHWCVTQLGC